MAFDLGTLVAYLKVDDTNLKRGLAAAQAQTDKLDGETATVKVDADTAEASAQIEEVQVQVDHLDGDTAKVNVKADTSNATRELSLMGNGISGMTAAIAGLGPALIPVTAAVAGLAGALAAPLAAAGGGLGLFAVIGGLAVAHTQKQLKALGQMRKKMAADQLAVDKASTAAGKKSAMATLAADTTAYKNALADLSPAQTRFMNAENKVKGAFAHLVKVAGPALFGPMVTAMRMLAKVMPYLTPLLKAVSGAISDVFRQVGKAVQGGVLNKLLGWFTAFSGPAIKGFASILGGIVTGFVGLFSAMSPLSGSLMGGLTKMADTFATWGQNASSSKGFQGFLAYVQQVGPLVAKTFGDIVGAVVNVVKFLAPLGGVILGVVDGIASFIRHAKPGTLDAIALAIGGIAMAFGKGPLGLAFALGATLSHSDKFLSFLKGAGKLAGNLADAFGKLPAGVQDAAAAAVGVGAIALKLRGGKGGGGVVSKVLGGIVGKGVQKVWVMNPGFGGGEGIPGVPGKGKPRSIGAGAAGALITASPYLLPLLTGGDTAPGQDTAGLTPGQIKAHHSMQAALSGLYKGLGTDQFGFKGGKSADQLLGHLLDSNSLQGLKLLAKAADTAGVKWNKFATDAMPKTQGAVKLLIQRLGSLPRQVATKVLTPGAIDSWAQVHKLKAQYDLTPKQVQTLVQLLGGPRAIRTANELKDVYAGIPRYVRTQAITDHIDRFDRQTGAPHRAAGGPIMGGSTYLVGESGPELFTSRTAGSITSNHALRTASGGGATPMVAHLYDVDGALIGRMRGEARAEINGQHGFHGTLERMNR